MLVKEGPDDKPYTVQLTKLLPYSGTTKSPTQLPHGWQHVYQKKSIWTLQYNSMLKRSAIVIYEYFINCISYTLLSEYQVAGNQCAQMI